MTQSPLIDLLNETLLGLKDFQHATVDRVTHHFLNDDDHHNRILVADEVGLGKTIVAKGIIARLLIDRINYPEKRQAGPLRVIYICSNQALAHENLQKLSLFINENDRRTYLSQPQFNRLAELALQHETGNPEAVLELCSLTPGTSFNLTSGNGNRTERIILLEAVTKIEALSSLKEPLKAYFHANMGKAENFYRAHEWLSSNRRFDEAILSSFHASLCQNAPSQDYDSALTWVEILRWIAVDEHSAREDPRVPSQIIPSLRRLLAEACASRLYGDLFILDEFQRFSSLIHGEADSEEAIIASKVFQDDQADDPNQRPWVLLLSATPFKAMTTEEESEADESHIESLNRILSFLNQQAPDQYRPVREALYQELLKAKHSTSDPALISADPRNRVEGILRSLISRTERVQLDRSYDEVLDNSEFDCSEWLDEKDIHTWQSLDAFSQELGEHARIDPRHQVLQFYLSAAWPLAFSTGYSIRDHITRYHQKRGSRALAKYKSLFLPRRKFNDFSIKVHKDAPNPRVRALTDYLLKNDDLKEGPEAMLWVPPALPHYQMEGPFNSFQDFTKTLIFSAWAMVPRMMSALLSYETERRLQFRKPQGDYFRNSASDRSHNQLINLADGALAQWALIYPSRFLASYPLKRSGQNLDALIKKRTECIKRKLSSWEKAPHRAGKRVDKKWYLMALFFLDDTVERGNPEQWLTQMGDDDSLSPRQRERVREIYHEFDKGPDRLGALPADIAHWLAWLSVGSPAVCATRMLDNTETETPADASQLSTEIARAFVSLFNRETGSQIIRNRMRQKSSNRQPQKMPLEVARYCAQGGLQAMLEEYFNVVLASSGRTAQDRVQVLSDVLQTSHADVRAWDPVKERNTTFRCRYAVPLGSQSMQRDSGTDRVINIRQAFNSPFRPFVVTSTSVGQEGLDFHAYCREIVHWNLPSNPIDLEQREGRVNRYQSLVVRKRLAERYADQLEANEGWEELLSLAQEDSRSKEATDLSPHWHSPEGQTKISRIVPMMPLSKDAQRFDTMQRILSLYRLTFGQPGQEELARYLGNLADSQNGEALLEQIKEKLTVRLAPIIHKPSLSRVKGVESP